MKKKASKEHTVAIYKKTKDTLKILHLIHIQEKAYTLGKVFKFNVLSTSENALI